MTERKKILLEFTCTDFPEAGENPGLYLGLVEGKQVVQEVSLAQAQARGETHFSTKLEVLLDESGQEATFYGPAAQGPPRERFVYLTWQRQAAEGWQQVRRIKVPLNIFPPAYVAQALVEDRALRLQIRVRDPKGNPAAATLKGESLQILS